MANFADNNSKMTLVGTTKDLCRKENSSLQRFTSEAGQPCFMIGSYVGRISKNLLDKEGNFDKDLLKTSQVSLSEWTTDSGEEAQCLVLHRSGNIKVEESFSFED
jgi:hypothetical protein